MSEFVSFSTEQSLPEFHARLAKTLHLVYLNQIYEEQLSFYSKEFDQNDIEGYESFKSDDKQIKSITRGPLPFRWELVYDGPHWDNSEKIIVIYKFVSKTKRTESLVEWSLNPNIDWTKIWAENKVSVKRSTRFPFKAGKGYVDSTYTEETSTRQLQSIQLNLSAIPSNPFGSQMIQKEFEAEINYSLHGERKTLTQKGILGKDTLFSIEFSSEEDFDKVEEVSKTLELKMRFL